VQDVSRRRIEVSSKAARIAAPKLHPLHTFSSAM